MNMDPRRRKPSGSPADRLGVARREFTLLRQHPFTFHYPTLTVATLAEAT
jgi:hypothetical protein